MAQVPLLISTLKRFLKGRGLTYADVAQELGISESSVKRLFSRQHFSLDRLEQICHVAGIEISDLVEHMNASRAYVSELTLEQERTLVGNRKLLLMAYLLITGWSVDQVTANFEIDEVEAGRLLVQLHRARIIELLPLNRFRLLTSRHFKWRANGPIHKLFREQVQTEFFDSAFNEDGASLRFVGGMLSATGLSHMKNAIDRLAREFDELSRKDALLPLSERRGCSAVFAMRPWEFSMFDELRRRDR